MKNWQRRVIGILTLGGSSAGLGAIATEVPISEIGGFSLLIFAVFSVVFLYGIAVGVLILENAENSLGFALPFWLAQIPVIQFPWVSYRLFTGAKFDIVYLSNHSIDLAWSGGSRVTFLLNTSTDWAIGANVVAIVVSYFIWNVRSESAVSVKRHIGDQ